VLTDEDERTWKEGLHWQHFRLKSNKVDAGKSNGSNPLLADSFVISRDDTPDGMQTFFSHVPLC
jgi:hypothetical protein